MKKINVIISIITIYLGLIFMNTQVLAVDKATAQNDNVRIREKATTDSEVVTVIPENATVEIENEDGDWYKVTYQNDGKTYDGYIRKDLLKVEETKKEDVKDEKKEETKTETEQKEDEKTETEQKENEQKNPDVNQVVEIKEGATGKIAVNLEVRVLPLINSSVAETIKSNEDITLGETLGNWTYVQSLNENGWVMTSELENNIVEGTVQKEDDTVIDDTTTEVNKEESTENKEQPKTEKESKKESTTEETKTLYVSSETVNIRKEPNTKSEVIDQVSLDDKVTVLGEVDNIWSKVQVGNKTGYMATEYLSSKRSTVSSRGTDEVRKKVEEEKEIEKKEEKKEEEKKQTETKEETTKKETTNKVVTSNAQQEEKKTENKTTEKKEEKKEDKKESTKKVTGSDIVAKAKKYLGYKYVLGAASPKSGFDCSGLVYYVYGQFGYKLSRTSGAQASNGKKVSKSNLQLGDVLVFNNSSNTSIGHVGIYIGGNQFIHAANPRKGVIITSLSDSYYAKRYVTARRIID